jgi:hypothetical protein
MMLKTKTLLAYGKHFTTLAVRKDESDSRYAGM